MKITIDAILIVLCCCSGSAAQLVKLDLRENSFSSAIDWYIGVNKELINARTGKKEALKDAMIVSVTVLNLKDSFATINRQERGYIVEETKLFSRCNLLMTLEPFGVIAEVPPAAYFFRGDVFVAVYTGIEKFIEHDKKELQRLERSVTPKELILIDRFKKYMIQIDERYKQGFSPIEIPN